MQDNKYTLKVNGRYGQQISQEDLGSLDIVSTGKGTFHVIKNDKSYRASIGHVNKQNKSVSLWIGDERFEVDIKDSYDELIDQLGLSLNIVHQINEIKAPMPGLVVSIEVVVGQEIAHGDPLLVLEAMKMENVIKSPGEGVVKAILTKKGKPVDKGEILIELD